MILQARSEVLYAASLFAAKNDVRYYLNGIYIERESDTTFYVVGINGHVAFMSRQTVKDHAIPESFKSVILAGNTLPQLSRAADVRLLTIAEGWATVEVGPQPTARKAYTNVRRHLVQCIDGRFPEWRKPLTSALAGKPENTTLDTAYMDLCSRAEKVLNGGRSRQAHFSMRGEAPTLVTFSDQKSVGVVMPMRDLSSPCVPAWAEKLTCTPTAEAA